MFLHLCVILFTGRGCLLSACWDTTPWNRHPPDQATPGSRPPHPHPIRAELARRYGQRAGEHPTSILLECILVLTLSLPYVNIGFNSLCTHLEAMPISLSLKCKRTLVQIEISCLPILCISK